MSACKCVKCGGTDSKFVCNHTFFSIQGAIYIQEKFGVWMFMAALIICTCGMFGLFDR